MTNPQMEALCKALCEAFNQNTLEQMLRFRLGKVREHLAGSMDMPTVVFQVVEAAVREGWHRDLIREAVSYIPGNQALRRFHEEYTQVSIAAITISQNQGLAPSETQDSGNTITPRLQHYEIIQTIFEGHYSRVLKCRIPTTGEICIVKETAVEHVCLKALQLLTTLSIPNIAKPRRIWEEAGKVYEELPYVGGVRLSSAIVRDIGGLTGSVLESFHEHLQDTLAQLHKVGIVHRDIHPDNIYMVIKTGNSPPPKKSASGMALEFERFGKRDQQLFLAWVIVDCTFVALFSEPQAARYRHGSYTPEEQQTGAARPESDMYAFGATMYYGITGREIPPFKRRRENPRLLQTFPSGDHASRRFSEYLGELLSLDPRQRPLQVDLQKDTVIARYTGTLRIAPTSFLIADHFDWDTRLLEGEEALAFFRQLEGHRPKESRFWIEQLRLAGIEE